MRLERTTAPATDFISVAEAAFNVAGDATFDATKLARDIKAAIKAAEEYCERAFINQVWTITLDKFPSVTKRNPFAAIYIPKGKLQSLASNQITYLDTDGVAQTLDKDTDFFVQNTGDTAMLVPSVDGWPSTYVSRPNVVTIVATVGYGTSLPDDMADIKDACLLKIGDLYEMRQINVPVKMYNTMSWEMLLNPYKIFFDFSVNDE